MTLRLIPVLDMKHGVVVRGIGGRRHEYRPIVSRLCPSAEPLAVAHSFGERLGLNELYLADLDAIAGLAPAVRLYRELSEAGCRLWVDAGVCDITMGRALTEAGVATVVVGLETLPGPQELQRCCAALQERLVFSLDLKGGQPIGETGTWHGTDARTIARQAISLGVRRLLVLDLARVGEGGGTGTEDLCAEIAARHPHVELAAGGGIRGLTDLFRLEACGVQAALVASALHDGTLTRHDLDQLRSPLDRG